MTIAFPDRECVHFLQWALPRLGLHWPGFRRVRNQVRKRIAKRLEQLGLVSAEQYRDYLQSNAEEWERLSELTRISISRFHRDRDVFEYLRTTLLPSLVVAAQQRGDSAVRIWSAGCASGEEPYSIAILCESERVANPTMEWEILATDADSHMLMRAESATYPESSLRDAPSHWRTDVFTPTSVGLVMHDAIRRRVRFQQQDLRIATPTAPFQLVLCRNLAFTYFSPPIQKEILAKIEAAIAAGGALVLGKHETLPIQCTTLQRIAPHLPIYVKAARRLSE